MKLIDADALSKAMYESAFEKDNDEQKWDSGCWIRYKMFERNLENAPTVDAVPVVRCKDCKYCEYPKSEKEWCKKGHLHGNAEDWFCADGEKEG